MKHRYELVQWQIYWPDWWHVWPWSVTWSPDEHEIVEKYCGFSVFQFIFRAWQPEPINPPPTT